MLASKTDSSERKNYRKDEHAVDKLINEHHDKIRDFGLDRNKKTSQRQALNKKAPKAKNALHLTTKKSKAVSSHKYKQDLKCASERPLAELKKILEMRKLESNEAKLKKKVGLKKKAKCVAKLSAVKKAHSHARNKAD